MFVTVQRKINDLRLRSVIYASLAAPLLVLWLVAYYSWASWQDNQVAQLAVVANDMSDQVIAAAGLQAIERGATAGALSAPGKAGDASLAAIRNARARGSAAWQAAVADAEHLIADPRIDPGFTLAFRQAQTLYSAVEEARHRVDSSLGKDERDISVADWLKTMTAFIGAGARMSIRVFGGNALPQEISYPNLTLKHQVWLASEFAGLERANVASLIGGNTALDPELKSRLLAYRQTVDANIREILFLKQVPGTDPALVQAVDGMEKDFLGRFEQQRRQMYAEAAAPDAPEGHRYSMSRKEWFDSSTQAINSILAVAEVMSKISRARIERVAAWRKLQMVGYAAVFVLMLTVLIVTVRMQLVKLRHLDRLRASMEELAAGEGDLTRRLDASTRDEIGRTSAAFNRFVEKLQTILRDVSTGADSMAEAASRQVDVAKRVSLSSVSQSEMSSSTAAAVEQVSVSLASVADSAEEVRNLALQSLEQTHQGNESLSGLVGEISEVESSVEAISSAVDEFVRSTRDITNMTGQVKDIAEQTNLLALNAAIEAARAGEQGRGFAVVADEVRKLAEKSSQSAGEIDRITRVLESQSGAVEAAIRQGQGALQSSQDHLENVAVVLSEAGSLVQSTTAGMDEINASVREQRAASTEIANNVERIAQSAEANSAAANESVRDADELRGLAFTLKDTLGKFKLQ
ncbi:MAG: methyl-accepting chemotaxis protein [Burkholderiales bacterium]